uniref:Deoxyribonuclease 1 like 2 n=1 Tax=Anas platyrhynchos TaxID=8839 RepID=A0A8B9TVE8_ANAPL
AGWGPRCWHCPCWPVALVCPATATLRIGAFNIQVFGDSKMSDEAVAGVLRRYDVVLVQEVRDSDLSAVTELMEQLNSVSSAPYDYEISGPLGRENYKEMYLFIYRTDVVSVVDTYQYEDPQDIFSREPFILRHDAAAEIDALYDVYLAVLNKWGTDNIVFLGDFNADCAYVKPSDWASIRLRTSDSLQVADPRQLRHHRGQVGLRLRQVRALCPTRPQVYNFQRAFQLEQEEALAVSDHYPVEVKLMA